MRNIIIAFATFIVASGLNFIHTDVAEAGQKCSKKMSRDACEVWLRQQTAPKLTGPKAPSEPVRCAATLSDRPSALVLRMGEGNKGPAVISWRLASLDWKKTHRGFETTACFPKRLVEEYDSLTLCGANGHSSWGIAEMSHLRKRDIGSGDPACTGGDSWCAQHGL